MNKNNTNLSNNDAREYTATKVIRWKAGRKAERIGEASNPGPIHDEQEYDYADNIYIYRAIILIRKHSIGILVVTKPGIKEDSPNKYQCVEAERGHRQRKVYTGAVRGDARKAREQNPRGTDSGKLEGPQAEPGQEDGRTPRVHPGSNKELGTSKAGTGNHQCSVELRVHSRAATPPGLIQTATPQGSPPGDHRRRRQDCSAPAPSQEDHQIEEDTTSNGREDQNKVYDRGKKR